MFELAFPWVLILIPLPVLVWFLLPRVSQSFPSALKVPFFNMLTAMVEQKKPRFSQQAQLGLFFVIWTLMILALSGPRWVGKPQPIATEGYSIMLALDISGSMELPDMLFHGRPTTRLAVVKRAAEQFVQERTGDKIGLVLFGSRAYLQTPLTYDRQNVLARIDDATVGLAGKTTSIGDAIGLAVKRLQRSPAKGRVLILLTDGANNSGVLSPKKAAELAHAAQIKIYTIGLGSEGDPRALNGFLMNISADLDEETLQKVAEIAGGRYFRATDLQSLEAIYQTINQLEKETQAQESIRPQWEYYYWPLGMAFFLLIYWMGQHSGILLGRKSAKLVEGVEHG